MCLCLQQASCLLQCSTVTPRVPSHPAWPPRFPLCQALTQTASQGGGQAAAAAKAVAQAAQQSEGQDAEHGGTKMRPLALLATAVPCFAVCAPDCTTGTPLSHTHTHKLPQTQAPAPPFQLVCTTADPGATAAALSQALTQAQSTGQSKVGFDLITDCRDAPACIPCWDRALSVCFVSQAASHPGRL